jgi:hypothetical protein
MINFQRNPFPPTSPSSVEAKSNNKGLHWWMDGNQCAMLCLLHSDPMTGKLDSLIVAGFVGRPNASPTSFVGQVLSFSPARIATYRYCNMDHVVGMALSEFDKVSDSANESA